MATRHETIKDHQERLNRVLDHLGRHLDEPLDLDRLAAVACFSPFHFHRIFAAHVGETVWEHVQRLRLELAAHRLTHTQRTVTDIALAAGYETPSAFTRAFGQRFGASPTVFRQARRHALAPTPMTLSLDSSAKEISMQPEIRTREETVVVYARRIGDYNQSARSAWEAVCAYAGPQGLIGPQSQFIGCSHDDPSITPAEKLRYDACITVDRAVEPAGDIGVQTIDGGRFAVFLHAGPYSDFSRTYGAIYGQWLPGSGEKLRDASCLEIYLNSPDQVQPEQLRTEIWVAIE
jgi:AraC family transcriptional regulator